MWGARVWQIGTLFCDNHSVSIWVSILLLNKKFILIWIRKKSQQRSCNERIFIIAWKVINVFIISNTVLHMFCSKQLSYSTFVIIFLSGGGSAKKLSAPPGTPPPAMTSGNESEAPTMTGSTPQNGENKPPQAIVKPQVLTHIIEGFVIQEGAEPFPVCVSRWFWLY